MRYGIVGWQISLKLESQRFFVGLDRTVDREHVGPNGHVSISDWLRCLIWTPVRADMAATSA
eukprot:1901280-Pyramimonas_sp.AAC.2